MSFVPGLVYRLPLKIRYSDQTVVRDEGGAEGEKQGRREREKGRDETGREVRKEGEEERGREMHLVPSIQYSGQPGQSRLSPTCLHLV
ncbi:hypothetical protein E2C01_070295 [Portunus trituberculatus]|uniref:Uncharacterized protein n=1 Tax=Portunus trituberculatus TaxID=210409 RepID=A0A5B7I1Q2_PORTR|nr:hypothetical protein [Portunus trituberculatus]